MIPFGYMGPYYWELLKSLQRHETEHNPCGSDCQSETIYLKPSLGCALRARILGSPVDSDPVSGPPDMTLVSIILPVAHIDLDPYTGPGCLLPTS